MKPFCYSLYFKYLNEERQHFFALQYLMVWSCDSFSDIDGWFCDCLTCEILIWRSLWRNHFGAVPNELLCLFFINLLLISIRCVGLNIFLKMLFSSFFDLFAAICTIGMYMLHIIFGSTFAIHITKLSLVFQDMCCILIFRLTIPFCYCSYQLENA